ncbi:uncharacterized protein V1510DRAFT_403489 [Dipodascopsis tothii]|uniref:uncharacterized protein n=1 Tax=Dipodascopsis tothii TaxID=44089 RepID=UPI0034CE6FEF
MAEAVESGAMADAPLWLAVDAVAADRPQILRSPALSGRLLDLATRSKSYRARALRSVGDAVYFDGQALATTDAGDAALERQYLLELSRRDPQPRKALALWSARRPSRDRAWTELGLDLYLGCRREDAAIALAADIEAAYGTMSPSALTKFVVHEFAAGRPMEAIRLYDHLARLADDNTRKQANLKRCLRAALDANARGAYERILADVQALAVGEDGGVDEAVMLFDHLTAVFVRAAAAERLRERPSGGILHAADKVRRLSEYADVCTTSCPAAADSPEYYRVLLDRLGRLGSPAAAQAAAAVADLAGRNLAVDPFHAHGFMRAQLPAVAAADDFLRLMEHIRRRELAGEPVQALLGPPTAAHYALLVQHWCRRSNAAGAQEVLDRMRSLDVAPDTTVCNALLDRGRRARDYGLVWSVYNTMRRLQIRPDARVLTAIWRALAAADADARRGLPTAAGAPSPRELLATPPADVRTVQYAAQHLIAVGDMAAAVAVLDAAARARIAPDEALLTTVLAAAGRSGGKTPAEAEQTRLALIVELLQRAGRGEPSTADLADVVRAHATAIGADLADTAAVAAALDVATVH